MAKGSKVSTQTGFERHSCRRGALKCTLCGNMSIMCVSCKCAGSASKRRVEALRPQSATRLQNHLWGRGWNLHLSKVVVGGQRRKVLFSRFTYFFTWRPDRTLRTNKTLKESWKRLLLEPAIWPFYHFSTAKKRLPACSDAPHSSCRITYCRI